MDEPVEPSVVGLSYSGGFYFNDPARHSEDAKFKADNFLKLFLRFASQNSICIKSFIDVGCGSGSVIELISDALEKNGFAGVAFKGYDVSPHVRNIQNDNIEFVHGDFCQSDELVDLVTLFDVFEHVTDPIANVFRSVCS